MDFRWLIRSVIKDYSSLNNRVLKDLARLEEENKVHIIRSKKAEVSDKNTIESFVHGDPFKPLEKVLVSFSFYKYFVQLVYLL